MTFTEDIRAFIKAQINLTEHTQKCINLFNTYIEKYEAEAEKIKNSKYAKKLICLIEVQDDLYMTISFASLPGIARYMKVLNDQDHSFFEEPQFFPWQKQVDVGIKTIKKIDENNQIVKDIETYNEHNYNEVYHEFQPIYEEFVEKWLAAGWKQANTNKQTAYPLYYFYHGYLHKSLNLLDDKIYDLIAIDESYE